MTGVSRFHAAGDDCLCVLLPGVALRGRKEGEFAKQGTKDFDCKIQVPLQPEYFQSQFS